MSDLSAIDQGGKSWRVFYALSKRTPVHTDGDE